MNSLKLMRPDCEILHPELEAQVKQSIYLLVNGFGLFPDLNDLSFLNFS